jgi:hypothetical protein
MNRKVGWLLAGMIVGIVAVGPWQARSEAGTGKATIRINDRVLASTRIDMNPLGASPGDQEIIRARLLERGTGATIGRSELLCTFVDSGRSRSCRGTYILPKGKLVVGGSLLYRQFYELAVLGGTGLYDNARGTLTITRTGRKPIRDAVVFRLVG